MINILLINKMSTVIQTVHCTGLHSLWGGISAHNNAFKLVHWCRGQKTRLGPNMTAFCLVKYNKHASKTALLFSLSNPGFVYLEQCGLCGVQFRVAVNHSFHSWRTIPNNQQGWAPMWSTEPEGVKCYEVSLLPMFYLLFRSIVSLTWLSWHWRSLQGQASLPPERCGCCRNVETDSRWIGSLLLWCSDDMLTQGLDLSGSHPIVTVQMHYACYTFVQIFFNHKHIKSQYSVVPDNLPYQTSVW